MCLISLAMFSFFSRAKKETTEIGNEITHRPAITSGRGVSRGGGGEGVRKSPRG